MSHKSEMELLIPDPIFIKKYRDKFDIEEEYKYSEELIDKIIEIYPKNDNYNVILLKTKIINLLYYTNIRAINKIAKHIFKIKDFDQKVKKGYSDIIKEIASGHGILHNKGKEYYFYSFATKYCSFHNKKDYPLYDNILENLLKKYRKEKIIDYFHNSDIEID